MSSASPRASDGRSRAESAWIKIDVRSGASALSGKRELPSRASSTAAPGFDEATARSRVMSEASSGGVAGRLAADAGGEEARGAAGEAEGGARPVGATSDAAAGGVSRGRGSGAERQKSAAPMPIAATPVTA